MKQFPAVDCSRGAPMGRASRGHPENTSGKIRLFRVRLDSGGYDDGGAYWGNGDPLWCATDGAYYREFTRAGSRFHAAGLMGVLDRRLKKPISVFRGGAFHGSGMQYTGHPSALPRFVVYKWGERLGDYPSKGEALAAVWENTFGREG